MKKELMNVFFALNIAAAAAFSCPAASCGPVHAQEPAQAQEEESIIVDDGYSSGMDCIEVSISQQHVWHHVGGEVASESACVTGTLGSRDTPVGTFRIVEKVPGTYLTPTGGSPVWVDRWMRITSDGVGLHDAPWRSEFGGGIYAARGSHGCINLPVDYAYKLYDEVGVGYKVVVEP